MAYVYNGTQSKRDDAFEENVERSLGAGEGVGQEAEGFYRQGAQGGEDAKRALEAAAALEEVAVIDVCRARLISLVKVQNKVTIPLVICVFIASVGFLLFMFLPFRVPNLIVTVSIIFTIACLVLVLPMIVVNIRNNWYTSKIEKRLRAAEERHLGLSSTSYPEMTLGKFSDFLAARPGGAALEFQFAGYPAMRMGGSVGVSLPQGIEVSPEGGCWLRMDASATAESLTTDRLLPLVSDAIARCGEGATLDLDLCDQEGRMLETAQCWKPLPLSETAFVIDGRLISEVEAMTNATRTGNISMNGKLWKKCKRRWKEVGL